MKRNLLWYHVLLFVPFLLVLVLYLPACLCPDGGMACLMAVQASGGGDGGVDVATGLPRVHNDRGDFWVCGTPPGTTSTRGYAHTGCCTNGRWRETGGVLQTGMLVRVVDPRGDDVFFGAPVYLLYRRNGELHAAVFPSVAELNSWYLPSSSRHLGIDVDNPTACASVYGVTHQQLSIVRLWSTITFRPGTTYVRLATDEAIFAVGPNRTLHEVRFLGRPRRDLADWKPSAAQIRVLPDAFFVRYEVPTTIVIDGSLTPAQVLSTFDDPTASVETNLP